MRKPLLLTTAILASVALLLIPTAATAAPADTSWNAADKLAKKLLTENDTATLFGLDPSQISTFITDTGKMEGSIDGTMGISANKSWWHTTIPDENGHTTIIGYSGSGIGKSLNSHLYPTMLLDWMRKPSPPQPWSKAEYNIHATQKISESLFRWRGHPGSPVAVVVISVTPTLVASGECWLPGQPVSAVRACALKEAEAQKKALTH